MLTLPSTVAFCRLCLKPTSQYFNIIKDQFSKEKRIETKLVDCLNLKVTLLLK